jgi:hypothetical protein
VIDTRLSSVIFYCILILVQYDGRGWVKMGSAQVRFLLLALHMKRLQKEGTVCLTTLHPPFVPPQITDVSPLETVSRRQCLSKGVDFRVTIYQSRSSVKFRHSKLYEEYFTFKSLKL